jgi:hypothetical protein
MSDDLLKLLRRFLNNIDSYDVYTVLRVNNLIQAAVLDALEQGRISKEVADKILFSEEEI